MPRRSTNALWDAAAHELAGRASVLRYLHERHGPPRLAPRTAVRDRFESLASSIAYQQLAGRAAATIWGRVAAAVGSPFTAGAVLDAGPEVLRSAGLSAAKTAAMLDLAAKVDDGTVRLGKIGRLGDVEVVEHLTVVRGIGPWTAQMFLLFDLRRIDVWPIGDLGVRSGLARVHGWDEVPAERDMTELGQAYAPYRSVMAWWCWREVDTVTPSASM